MIIVICLLTEKAHKFKATIKNVYFLSQFCLKSIFHKSDSVELEEVSSKRNVYDFPVDYDAIDKSNILNIHKYLMVKNNIK